MSAQVVVIGGGPAGIMAAITAAREGKTVTLLERNQKIGRKLYVSGKGRCNLTNVAEGQDFLANVVSNPKFLMSASRALTSSQVTEYFQNELNVPLKVERGGRVFPVSDKSSDIIDALLSELRRRNVKIVFGAEVSGFELDGKRITAVNTTEKSFEADAVILATGGKSYPKTGSDGNGYALAESLGHTIIPPVAALSELILGDTLAASGRNITQAEMPLPEGLSLKNVTAKAVERANGRVVAEEFGEMLFTSNGVSGPIILSLSSRINRTDPTSLRLEIDLKPALDAKTLDARLLKELAEAGNKQFKNSLGELLPKSLIPFAVKACGINPDKAVNSITKFERGNLLRTLKSLAFELKGLAPLDAAIVTAGGINVKEVVPGTMKSRIIENLSFAGELLDVDALTGGFNIQIALSTGYLAGKNA